ncbi:hypothetical protein ACQKEN_03525 [Pseudomonas sp. NPDC078416]|uniref:hypothetical protein n=1 Tax=Pseudomonas sp. NPDC078416 TaxID=3390637 RepID=UPI003D045DD0
MDVNEAQVYLTKSSMGKLKNLYFESVNEVDEHVRTAVYREDLAWILSVVELKSLYAELLVASGIEKFRISGTKAQRNDGLHLFRTNGPLKYHFDSSCGYLNSDYLNFSIPPEIKLKGPDEIEKFRVFAEANKHLLQDDQERFLTALEARFLLKTRPQRIEYNNSGQNEFSLLTVEEMEQAIQSHLRAAKEFHEANPEVRKRTFAPRRVIDSPQATDLDREWHNVYKHLLKSMLSQYYRKSHDHSQEESFLKSLGFEACKACAKAANTRL